MTNDEKLGPAERLIQALLQHADHMVHNRPGLVVPSATSAIGVDWSPVTSATEGGQTVVYRLTKVGKASLRARVGVLDAASGAIFAGGAKVAEYRAAGIFPEVATWMYRQVAEVWKLDNELAARWASYAFGQEHRDLKVVLAAFMLVQSRKGDAVLDGGQLAFHDEDYRDVGEAMCLVHTRDKRDLNPKLLLRIHDVLSVPGVAALNRALGFGHSATKPFLGRWSKAVEKWLGFRDENPRLLEGLVKAGFRTSVMELARRVGFKPAGPRFFEILRWKQKQARDGRRGVAIGAAVTVAESWAGLGEAEVCARIVAERPSWKRIVSLLPAAVGVTRAVVAAAIEAGVLSDKDLVIMTPTLEELGLMEVPAILERWVVATQAAEDTRAANIAARVRSKAVAEVLVQAADAAVTKAVEEVTRKIRVYFFVDVSGSMQGAIEAAKGHIVRFLGGFPLAQLHVATFNTTGREIGLKHASAVGVENAFRGIAAGGGTDYGAGVKALAHLRPQADEDVLFVFVGDEDAEPFAAAVRTSGLAPLAFGFVKVVPPGMAGSRDAVRKTAVELGLPCFVIEPSTFADPYAVPRTIRALIAATPVGKSERAALVESILRTRLLEKPAWAA